MAPPKSITVGIPAAQWTFTLWTEWLLQWMSEPTTFERSIRFAPNNTKAIAYSDLIEAAKENDSDHLVILETNHVIEIPFQLLATRIQQFQCVISPTYYPDRGYQVDPVHYDCVKELPPKDAPFEIRTGGTGLVALSREVLHALAPRFSWPLKSKEGTRETVVYCFDGDHVGDQWLDLPQSLFENVRSHGFGVWADPALKTQNMRLTGYPSYRLEEAARES